MRRAWIALVCSLVAVPGCDNGDAPGTGTGADDGRDTTADAEIADADDVHADGDDAATDADTLVDGDTTVAPTRALGMGDVTFVMPPAMFVGRTRIASIDALVDAAVLDALVFASGDVLTEAERMRVVAVRFDLCDRLVPGPCAADADASLRIVVQPNSPPAGGAPSFEDVALHAFYPIPRADVGELVASLRALAELGDTDPSAPLGPSAALAADPDGPYAEALGALVRRWAAPERLVRLTLFAQFSFHAALHWLFRGVERASLDVPLAPIVVPGIDVAQQEVLLLGMTSYDVVPVVDAPAGIALALDESAFAAAGAAAQRTALEALAAIDDPRAHTPDTAQCMSCHVTTNLMAARAPVAAIDPSALAGRYPSPLAPAPYGSVETMSRTLRALGYVGSEPVVSQRAANESAAVATEIEARFPGARPDAR